MIRAPRVPDPKHLRKKRLRMLPPPSPEQQLAIDTLLHSNNNLIINACAGSGKTTTILHMAQAAPEVEFLLIVYNRRLMFETEERVQGLGLKNIQIFNYHTFGGRYYTSECATDQGLKRIVEDDMSVKDGMVLPNFSVLVLDEQQDMTPILKRFIDKVLRDKGFGPKTQPARKDLRIVAVGDKRQELYGFNNADSRFLTMVSRPEVFGYLNKNEWTTINQTTSHRITQQNVTFINQQMLKSSQGAVMRAVRNKNEHGVPFPKPRYVICDPYKDLLDEVLRLLGLEDVLPADIIILAPTVRGSSPAIYLANALALKGIPVFRSDSDVSNDTPRVAHEKILICTYHQAKGIERKASIVLGFDQNYYTRYNNVTETPTEASNPQYVAVTRALNYLVLIHDYRSPPLPFVNLETVNQSCDLVVVRPLQIEEPRAEALKGARPFNITALCRNSSEKLTTTCLEQLKICQWADPAFGIQPPPPTEVEDRFGRLEGVSNVTGTAVPAIFQWRRWKALTTLSSALKLLKKTKRSPIRPDPLRDLPVVYFEKLKSIADAYAGGILKTEDILYLSNLEMACKDHDIVKVLTIPLGKYTWLKEAHCRDILYTLDNLPDPAKIPRRGIQFEAFRKREFSTVTYGGGPTNPEKQQHVTVSGIIDIYHSADTHKTIWEIKNSESLNPRDILQVALYMLLGTSTRGFLVSARTGQVVQVFTRTPDSLMTILQLLVNSKSGGEQTRLLNLHSDEGFLAECKSAFSGLVGKCALPAYFAMKPSGSKYKKSNTAGKKAGGRGEKIDQSE